LIAVIWYAPSAKYLVLALLVVSSVKVTGPTLAMVGEKGPEAIVPLNKAGGFGGVTINVNGGISTSAQIGQAMCLTVQLILLM
jgi:hypothetical protein